jgi:hypothetical protein
LGCYRRLKISEQVWRLGTSKFEARKEYSENIVKKTGDGKVRLTKRNKLFTSGIKVDSLPSNEMFERFKKEFQGSIEMNGIEYLVKKYKGSSTRIKPEITLYSGEELLTSIFERIDNTNVQKPHKPVLGKYKGKGLDPRDL